MNRSVLRSAQDLDICMCTLPSKYMFHSSISSMTVDSDTVTATTPPLAGSLERMSEISLAYNCCLQYSFCICVSCTDRHGSPPCRFQQLSALAWITAMRVTFSSITKDSSPTALLTHSELWLLPIYYFCLLVQVQPCAI